MGRVTDYGGQVPGAGEQFGGQEEGDFAVATEEEDAGGHVCGWGYIVGIRIGMGVSLVYTRDGKLMRRLMLGRGRGEGSFKEASDRTKLQSNTR